MRLLADEVFHGALGSCISKSIPLREVQTFAHIAASFGLVAFDEMGVLLFADIIIKLKLLMAIEHLRLKLEIIAALLTFFQS